MGEKSQAHARLEDAYDPLFWTRSLDAAARLRLHDERAAERDEQIEALAEAFEK